MRDEVIRALDAMKNPQEFNAAFLAARIMHAPDVKNGHLPFLAYRPSWRAKSGRGFKDFTIRFQSPNVLELALKWIASRDRNFQAGFMRGMNFTSNDRGLYGQMFQTACINRWREKGSVELPDRRKVDGKTTAPTSDHAPTDPNAALSFKFQIERPIVRHEVSTPSSPQLDYEVFHYEGPNTSNSPLADVIFVTKKPATCHIIQIAMKGDHFLSGDGLRTVCKGVPSDINHIQYTAVTPDLRHFDFTLSCSAVDRLIDVAEKEHNRTIEFFIASSGFVSDEYGAQTMIQLRSVHTFQENTFAPRGFEVNTP